MHSNKLYDELEWSFYQIHEIHCRHGFYPQNVGVNLLSHNNTLQYVLSINVFIINSPNWEFSELIYKNSLG